MQTFLKLSALAGLLICSISVNATVVQTPVLYPSTRVTYGDFISKASETLYNSDPDSCSGPAYECVGLLMVSYDTRDADWMLGPVKKQTVANYMLREIASLTDLTRVVPPIDGNAGMILWPEERLRELSGKGEFKQQATCIFPDVDHFWLKSCADAAPECQDLGIFTAQEYLDYYADRRDMHCGWGLVGDKSLDKGYVNAALSVQKAGGASSANTVNIKGWDAYNPARIPIMAFYFYDWDTDNLGFPAIISPIELLQWQQHLYYQKTGIFAPILHLTSTDPVHGWDKVKFEYRDQEQSPEIPHDLNGVQVLVNIND
ncbi:UNVERIFIED_ORG: hypothetical protein M2414_004761 [Rahnella aquatilis]